MMRHLAFFLLLTCCAAAETRPDVLFIAVDDLNDWTSYLGGHPQTKTPNIDRLVARGTAFTNSHCAAPACNPSRAALMSGLRPWQTGIYTNGDPAQGVLKDVSTINRHFLANGYNTLGGGKIYHNFNAEGRRIVDEMGRTVSQHQRARGKPERPQAWSLRLGSGRCEAADMGDYKSDRLGHQPSQNRAC
jgi:arylsulfatase A-like enzyme